MNIGVAEKPRGSVAAGRLGLRSYSLGTQLELRPRRSGLLIAPGCWYRVRVSPVRWYCPLLSWGFRLLEGCERYLVVDRADRRKVEELKRLMVANWKVYWLLL